jgi:hypothetical protein
MLVGWAADLHARALLLLGKAEAARDWQAARGFLAEARRNVELLGRMTGLLDGPPSPSTCGVKWRSWRSSMRRSCGRSLGPPPTGLTSRRSVSILLSPCPRSSMGTGVERRASNCELGRQLVPAGATAPSGPLLLRRKPSRKAFRDSLQARLLRGRAAAGSKLL